MHPSRNLRIAQTSKNARENAINRRHRVRTSSVGRAGRSGVFASTSSFVVVVVVIGCSSASAAAVRPRRVVRRRPDIVFVFASHSHDGRHPDGVVVLSFPHVRRAFSMCPNCVFLSMRARDDRGRVFHIPFHPCLCFIIPIPSATSDATHACGRPRVGHVETSRVGVDPVD